MQDMQERILAEVEKAITANKLEAVQKGNYANTGHVYAMSGLTTTLVVTYQFDRDSACIGFFGPSVENAYNAGHIDDSPPLYRLRKLSNGHQLDYLNLKYANGERMGEMFDTLHTLLDERLR